MSDFDLEMMLSTEEDEPYLMFEHENAPWWMWPLLATVTITREQWHTRIKIAVIAFSLAFILSAILWGLLGVLFYLAIVLLTSVIALETYKYGRENAIKHSEQPPRLE